LEAALAGLDETQLLAAGACGTWSIKDVLAHLTACEAELVAGLSKARRGQSPGQVLAVNRGESGAIAYEPEWLDIDTLCRDIVNEARLAMRDKRDIRYTGQWENSWVNADARLVAYILPHLLWNAVKYSTVPSPVTVELARERNRAVLCVRDRGIGIPLADQLRLFEPFFRAENTKHIPGAGLGLAIVREAVELHGGTISFISEPGRGTAFKARIPA
jgi:signal transduction histidine kinase